MFIASLDVMPQIERNDRELADQIKRAASSVALNLAEGQRLTKGNKPKLFAITHDSANEVRAARYTVRCRCRCRSRGVGSRTRRKSSRHSIDCSRCCGGSIIGVAGDEYPRG